MNKGLIILLVLFLTSFCFSQTIFVVKDSKTLEVIEKASIYFSNEHGRYTDEDGKVEIPIYIKEIEISYLGYISQRLKVSEIKDVVLLKRTEFEIEEVVISNKTMKKKTKKIFPKIGINQLIPANYGDEMLSLDEEKAVFIPNEKDIKGLIVKVSFSPRDVSYFHLGKGKSETPDRNKSRYAPFLANLYTVDPVLGIPLNPIYETYFDVQLEIGKNTVVLEIPKEKQIEFPKEGIMIVVKSYPKEYYEKLGLEIPRPPSFKGIGTSHKSAFKQFEKRNTSSQNFPWKRDERAWEYHSVLYFGLEVELLED